jgi:hypothetical protein
MNRKERRAAAAKARNAKNVIAQADDDHRVLAVHEAGHAVVRVLTAEDFGRSREEAVNCIEVGGHKGVTTTADGNINIPDAITLAPRLSKELEDAADADGTFKTGDASFEDIEQFLKRSRGAGLDVDRWLNAMLLICVAGPLAEAKFSKRDPKEVLDGYHGQFDIHEATDSCAMAGRLEEKDGLIGTAVNTVWRMLDDSKTWAAVMAVADLIPTSAGKVPGNLIAATIGRAMS